MRILKFGGSSVAHAERIKDIIGIVKNYSQSVDTNLCLVVSAQSGITDELVLLCEKIPSNYAQCETILREIETRHLIALKALLPVAHQSTALAQVMAMCNELSDIVRGASLVGEVTPRTSDLILSFGERLSAYVITCALKVEMDTAHYTDARELIITDSTYGHATVLFESTYARIEEYFGTHNGLNVVTGFIASTAKGQTTTLGRSGSDYTAAILGAALHADAIEIWTDVDGVMTADPRFVQEAQSIEQLSYVEAMELSHFGAKVIFPTTMQPAMAKQIPILVKNTFNPSHHGTLICENSSTGNGFIKGISSLKNISLLNIEGSGMIGVAGVSARLFTALSQNRISVILISQASSEHSICLAIMSVDAGRAVELIKNTFAEELRSQLISSISYESDLAIVAVVGENMRKMPGVSASVFNPLGRNGINIKAISQGSSELNISIVILEKDLKKALSALHQSLFNSELLQLHLYIAGTGAIGTELLSMIENQIEYHASQKIALKICGLCNSKKMLLDESGLDIANAKDLLGKSSANADLKTFVNIIVDQNLENSVFIDVTASDAPVEFYNELLAKNIAIVTANKRANTRSIVEYNLLRNAAKIRNTPFHYETNVGAGLPIISVLNGLRASGDRVIKIEAVLSGTMNYLLSEYNGEKSFSDLVHLAKENGYTEPDPRDDLSGMDVARKCLILARECGWEMELGNIQVDALMSDEAARAKDVPAFFTALQNYNAPFQKRFEDAKAKGKRIRYVAHLEGGKAKVSVQEVDEAHPFYNLKGTENCLSISSKYYQQYPMVIKGPGAGVYVTAAGVLADIVRITEGLKR
jgi:bifunctional aspartokinase / homoserine dehydrogenase 1